MSVFRPGDIPLPPAVPPAPPPPSAPPTSRSPGRHAARTVTAGSAAAPLAPAVARREVAAPRHVPRLVTSSAVGTVNRAPAEPAKPADPQRAGLLVRLANRARGALDVVLRWLGLSRAAAESGRDQRAATPGPTGTLHSASRQPAEYELPVPLPSRRDPTSPLPPPPDQPAPAAAPRAPARDVTALVLMLRQLTGINEEVRNSVYEQVDAGQATDRESMLTLVREATAAHCERLVEKWFSAECQAAGRPDAATAVPTEDAYEAVAHAVATHADVLDTADVERAARAALRELVVEGDVHTTAGRREPS